MFVLFQASRYFLVHEQLVTSTQWLSLCRAVGNERGSGLCRLVSFLYTSLTSTLTALISRRWMFLLEGIAVTLVGIAAFFMMTPSPSQTKTKWRPKGYYSDRDVDIIVNRVLRDDHTKSSMHNREGLSLSLLWKSFKDYDLWPLYIIGLTFGLAGYPISNYFQISMSTFCSNLDANAVLD